MKKISGRDLPLNFLQKNSKNHLHFSSEIWYTVLVRSCVYSEKKEEGYVFSW